MSFQNTDSVAEDIVVQLTRADNALHVRRRDLLKYPDFRRLLMSQFVSQVGDAAGNVLLAGLVLFLDPEGPAASQLAAMAMSSALPIILAGPLSGFLADRFTRRGILFHGQILRSLLAIATLASLFLSVDAVTFVTWAATLCAAKILYTARIASIRHLVRNHELVAADASSLTVGAIAGVVGGAIGVALVWSIGSIGFLIIAAAHIASGLVIRRISGVTGGGHEHAIAQWRDVVRHLRVAKLRYAMTTTGTHRVLLGITFACITIGADTSRNSASSLAAVVSASGLGMFMGTNTAEWVNEHFSRRVTAPFALGGSAAVLMIIGLVDTTAVALAGFAVCTFLFQNLRLCSDATIQSNAIPGAGGREFALYDANHNLLFIVGVLIGLFTYTPTNGPLILVACSTLSALMALVTIFMSRDEGESVAEEHASIEVDVLLKTAA